MAKPRFRDVKKGRVIPKSKNSSSKKDSKLRFATNFQKTKAAITDSFMLLMPIMYIVFYLVMGGREEFAENKLIGWIYILVPFIIVQTLFMYYGRWTNTRIIKNYPSKKVVWILKYPIKKPPTPFPIIFRKFLRP